MYEKKLIKIIRDDAYTFEKLAKILKDKIDEDMKAQLTDRARIIKELADNIEELL